jgi:hypothetical protein
LFGPVFAIPGISALIVFILARPQEFFPLLQRVPFLHIFTALAVLGWVIDIRLRRLQPVPCPTLPWVIALLGWSLVCTAAVTPELLITRAIEMAILFALYGTIAHGIQRFRTFQLVAGVLVTTCMFITLICFHQGLAPRQCIGGEDSDGDIQGHPDGRECENNEECRGPDAEPGLEYQCEHVGMFGTYTIEDRVRYKGELHDPNEVALTISAGALSLLIGFALRRRTPIWTLFLGVGVGVVFFTIFQTQSRGGLVAAMLVPAIYLLRRYGPVSLIPAALVALPVLLLGGRSGENADVSTQMRYEAWSTGLDMFHRSPVFGVGPRMFGEHHFLTAHNSFVLTLAEMGMPGMFLFVCVLYLSMKSLIVGIRTLANEPGTQAAQVWGMTLLASMAGIVFQINTLSFAYHSVLWIFFGLCGAWCSAVRHHRPDFTVKLSWKDLAIIATACIVYAFGILPVFLKAKGFM